MRAHDLLVATNRNISGRGYLQLREALERLQGTQIATNIITGDKELFDVFSLVDRARMQEVEIHLSDWVFRAVEAQEVLTLDRRYFQLAKPLKRRLYEIARKTRRAAGAISHWARQPAHEVRLAVDAQGIPLPPAERD